MSCSDRTVIDLAGYWEFALDRGTSVMADNPFYGTLRFLGMTDIASVGAEPLDTTFTTHLSRRCGFVGRAWFRRDVDIPRAWKDYSICLGLKRTKAAMLYLGGHLVASCGRVSVAQVSDLGVLVPGVHTIPFVWTMVT